LSYHRHHLLLQFILLIRKSKNIFLPDTKTPANHLQEIIVHLLRSNLCHPHHHQLTVLELNSSKKFMNPRHKYSPNSICQFTNNPNLIYHPSNSKPQWFHHQPAELRHHRRAVDRIKSMMTWCINHLAMLLG